MRFGSSLVACDQDHSLAWGANRCDGGSAQMRQRRMVGGLVCVRMADCWCDFKQWASRDKPSILSPLRECK